MAVSATTPPCTPLCPPAAGGLTSAPRPWSNRSGARRVIAEHGDRIAIGLDVRGRTLAARGWTREGGDLYDVLARLDTAGCARYVVTDVTKDGMLQGPNLDLLRDVCAATTAPVVASGGITELADLEALSHLVGNGVEGAIIGTALYEGRFTLEDALALTLPTVRQAGEDR